MKKLTLLAAVAVTILFTMSVANIDFNQSSDAMKSKGTSQPETGSKKVCGDRLCSEIDSKQEIKHHDSMTHTKSMDIHEMMERMDKIHEKHQQHMIQSWNSITADEQSQMYQKMQMMMEKMESMDMQEHMKMMLSMDEKEHDKGMHDDSDKKEHDKEMHKDSDEKHKTSDHLSMQYLETFDELDYDVFTNQKWDRLKESHSEDIIVHWPDGSQTEGIERHIEDLKAMFVYAPDTRIQEHPVKIASGEWTSVIGIIEGTFTEPMPLPDGTVIEPTGKSFKLTMVTVGHWNDDGVMDEEYLFWDNLSFMKQIGLS